MALTKEQAISILIFAAERRMNNELRYEKADFFRDEIISNIKYGFRENDLAKYVLVEITNGFYLGEVRNGMLNGFGVCLWYEDSGCHDFYLGYWKDGEMDGEDCIYCMKNAQSYYGGFVNGKFQGEECCFIDNSGLFFRAEFQQDNIVRVKYSNSGFTYGGKHYKGTSGW